MYWQVFIMGILTMLSPVIAFLQDMGWRAGNAEDLRWRFFSWLARSSWDQQHLMRGMVFAGLLLMGAGVLLGWKALW